MVSSGRASPMSGVWEGILSWQWVNRAALPRAGVSRFARVQHVWLQPLGLWVALKVMLCWTEDRVREMGAVHSPAWTGWTEAVVSRRQDSMVYEENSCTVWSIWQEIREVNMDDNNLKMHKGCKNPKGKSLWPIFHKGFSLLLLFTSVCD